MMAEGKSTLTPYDLITDELVSEALKNDLGPDAEVISWELQEFTSKGDNYSSIVTSISVKYKENQKTCETSFVAKLNPLRPTSSFTDLLEVMYAHETIVLREIAEGLNFQLNKLGLPPVKIPKLYARSLEKGKQVLITENLRTQSFRMHDRKKVMDVKHALLVVEELGRLHASSLLYEETLFPKSIAESFDYFEEPWTDFSNPSFKIFNTMMTGQCKSACNFLKQAPGYEKCQEWLNDRIDFIAKYFIEGFFPSKPFDVLTHGDCWTNNMLFKYDEEENPIDIRFVDLQGSRKSSPACDMNYFYYTCLNGEIRKKYGKVMEKSYYDSFSRILKMAGKDPPFTFSEFEEEMINRKLFGFVAGLLVLPIVLAEGDEIWDLDNVHDDNMDEFIDAQNSKFARIIERKGPFKDRFLTMFDEMTEYKIFDQ